MHKIFSLLVISVFAVGCTSITPAEDKGGTASSPEFVDDRTSDVLKSNVVVKLYLTKPNNIIDESYLDCSEVPLTNGEDHVVIAHRKGSFPQEWCGAKALNLPIETDAKGNAEILFYVEPSPEIAGIRPTMGPEYNVPMFGWKSGNNRGASGMAAISPTEWRSSPTIP